MNPLPLTLSQLRAIQERNRESKDALALLREIKRLHGVLHNCWQVFDDLPPEPLNSPLDLLRRLVNNEPCVKEQRARYDRVGNGKLPGR